MSIPTVEELEEELELMIEEYQYIYKFYDKKRPDRTDPNYNWMDEFNKRSTRPMHDFLRRLAKEIKNTEKRIKYRLKTKGRNHG